MKKVKRLGGSTIDLEQAYRQAMKYGGRMQYQYSGQMDPEDAAATDKAMYEYASTKKGIPTQILNKSQYGDMNQATLSRPSMGQYKGYDIKKDEYNVSPYMDEVVDEPTRVINTVKAEDARKTSNFAERQSAAKAAGTTKSGRSKEYLNYVNEAIPGMFAFEAREGDKTLGLIGPEGIMRLKDKFPNISDDEIRNITEDELYDPTSKFGSFIADQTKSATTRSTTSGEKGFGSIAQGDKGTNMLTPEGRFFTEALNNNAKFTPGYFRDKGAKAGLKMNDDQLDNVSRVFDEALSIYNTNRKQYNLNNPEDVNKLLDVAGINNVKDVKDYFKSIKPTALSEERTDLVRLRSKEETVENKPEIKQTTNIQPGNKLTYSQGFAKTTTNTQSPSSYNKPSDGGIWDRNFNIPSSKPQPTQGSSYFKKGAPTSTKPSGGGWLNPGTTGSKPGTTTTTTAGRTQSGSATTPATRQTTIETNNQPKTSTVKKYYTESIPTKYKNGGQFSMENARVLYRKGINNFEPRNAYQLSGQADPLPNDFNNAYGAFNKATQYMSRAPQQVVQSIPFLQKPILQKPKNEPFPINNQIPMGLDNKQQVPTYEHMDPKYRKQFEGRPKGQLSTNIPNPQMQEPKQFNPNTFDMNKLDTNQVYKNVYPQVDSAGRPIRPINDDPFSEEMLKYGPSLYKFENPQEDYEH